MHLAMLLKVQLDVAIVTVCLANEQLYRRPIVFSVIGLRETFSIVQNPSMFSRLANS